MHSSGRVDVVVWGESLRLEPAIEERLTTGRRAAPVDVESVRSGL